MATADYMRMEISVNEAAVRTLMEVPLSQFLETGFEPHMGVVMLT